MNNSKNHAISDKISTLADLVNLPRHFPSTRDCLAWVVRQKILSGAELFPDVFGMDREKRRLIEVLVTGKGALLTGEYGVAKTDLAKHVLILLNEYFRHHPVYYVEHCPIQEDPVMLARFASRQTDALPSWQDEPCPICKKLLHDAGKDLKNISVRRLDRLAEGAGFARVQGGGDVLPEEIVGTYNLLKLARIGDPFDPRVFEPGKIGQANRGLLFVDEIGKLPETAQHALIQACQEGIVTPSKSRETFPVDFLLVATTNPRDEEFICGAVRDRFVSLKIPLVGLDDEMRIVRKEVEKLAPPMYIPVIFLRLAVEIVRALRSDERLEIGPRTSINAGLIARSSALLEGRNMVSFCDIKEGIYTAILGKALYEEKSDVERKIDDLFPDIAAYIRKSLHGIDLEEMVKLYYGEYGDTSLWDAHHIKNLSARMHTSGNCGCDFAERIILMETVSPEKIYEVMAEYLCAFSRGCPSVGKSV